MRFLLWCILFAVSWPVAIAALVLYPVLWVLAVPFRLVFGAASALLDLAWAMVTLPVRLPLRLLRGHP